MSLSRSTDTDCTVTYAVQFVLEVDDTAFADHLLDALPNPEVTGVDASGHKTYVDETALGNPAVGASVPFADRSAAESLYESIRELEGFGQYVESGTLAIREHDDSVEAGYEPPVIARTPCP